MDNFIEPQVPQVTAQEVKHAIDEKEDCILLDVRTPGEFERGKIEGSINLPVDKIECDVRSVIPDLKAKVYVYCLSGSRSIHAVAAMTQLGYTNVFDMSHGLLAWRAKYFPVSP